MEGQDARFTIYRVNSARGRKAARQRPGDKKFVPSRQISHFHGDSLKQPILKMKKIFRNHSSLSLLLKLSIASIATAAADAPYSRHNLTSSQYQDVAVDRHNAGWRLQQVSGYEVNGSARYAGIWRKESGPALATHHGMSGSDYQNKFEDYAEQGFRLTWVDGYNVGNQTYFAAIWEKTGGSPLITHHAMTSSDYQNKFTTYKADGFRCVHVDGYRSGNSNRYAAIWVKDGGTFPRAHHGQSSADYQATVEQNVKDGFRPVHVSAWGAGNSGRFASLWEHTGGDPFWMRHNLNSQQYQAESENFHYTGYHVERVHGYTINGKPRFIAFWENSHMKASDLNLIENRIRDYMKDQGIPGVSVAIAKTGRLVYARGFGFADLESAALVSPTTRMRVASISKPITATAIMKLVDQGKLSVEDKVFGSGALLGTQYGTKAYNSDVKNIRVKHLLWHCSGWSNAGDDPMFNNHADHTAVIDWMLDNRAPAASPGNTDEYLNFGYCVLGRIIEEVSGQSYENYVRQHVLQPCGVTDMIIGAKNKANLAPNEATYYFGDGPYTWIRPRHFDSHGGWIASAADLLRFKVRVDGSAAKADIISNDAYTTMMTASPASSARAMGWRYGNNGYGHNGCMSGTIGFLWDTDDGYTFAILANTRPDDDGCAWNARSLVEDILYDVSEWPNYDLFTGSHAKAPILVINPAIGHLPGDLIFQAPTVLPALPKYEIIAREDSSSGRVTRLDVVSENERPANTTPFIPVETRRIQERGGQVFELSFPTADGWEYSIQRSENAQAWSSQTVYPDRNGTVIFTAPAAKSVELFRVQVQPEHEVIGIDPTDTPREVRRPPILRR